MKTIKIIGVSGSGKSSLMSALKESDSRFVGVNFSEYIKRFGKNAEKELSLFLASLTDEIVFMDEHMEIGEDDLRPLYKQENTIGLIYLDLSVNEILNRRYKDKSRARHCDRGEIFRDVFSTENRLSLVLKSLNLPTLFLRGMSLDFSVQLAQAFAYGAVH